MQTTRNRSITYVLDRSRVGTEKVKLQPPVHNVHNKKRLSKLVNLLPAPFHTKRRRRFVQAFSRRNQLKLDRH